MEFLIPHLHPADTMRMAVIGLSPTEAAALEAAGRAAGYNSLHNTLEALLSDGLDAGYRLLREQQDRETPAEAA